MNMKTVVPLVVALVLGVIAAKLGKDMMAKRGQGGGPGIQMTKIVVAREDIAPGSAIKELDVVLRDMPSDGMPQYAFTSTADVIGRVVTTQLVKGQTVMETLLAPRGTMGGVQAMVPPGMRAVTLEVNEFSGVGGLLTPGSRVDVVQTIRGKTEDGEDTMMAKTTVENLKVLAVGRKLSAVGGGGGDNPDQQQQLARSVTLLATTEQAEAIDLSSHLGQPRLVLRNGTDEKIIAGKGITVATLRGVEKDARADRADPIAEAVERMLRNQPATRPTEPVIDAAAPTYREVEIIRAGASTKVRLETAPSGETNPTAKTGAPGTTTTGTNGMLDDALPLNK
jgi:pilus assembly protein CpaB